MQPDRDHSSPVPIGRYPHVLDASISWRSVGGVQQVLSAKRAFLRAQGGRHTLLAPGAQEADSIDCGGVHVPVLEGHRFLLGRSSAARLMAQARPDIIEAADPYMLAWSALDAAARLRVPAVAFCHNNLPAVLARRVSGAGSNRSGRWAADLARRYLVRLYARYDLLLAPSRWMTEQLHAWGLTQAVHQPLGVDCSVFRPHLHDPAWRARLQQSLQLPSGTRLLVYAGRFGLEKNLDVLAAAVRRLSPRHALLAVGSGPCPPTGDRVRVLPPDPDRRSLARLLAACDVFVHAGDQESFGLATLEAMACGTPVVVSKAGGLGELVQGVGMTVEGLQADTWAEAIEAGLDEADRRPSLAALERARTHEWSRVLTQWCDRYHRALQVRSQVALPKALVAMGVSQ